MSAKAKFTATVSGGSTPPAQITVGGGVQVGPAGVNVRATPAGTLVGTQAPGIIGTVLAGPQNAPLNGVNVVWWQIDYQTGADGWTGSDDLLPVAAPKPPAPPTYHTWNAALNTEEAANPTPAALLAWINANPPKSD